MNEHPVQCMNETCMRVLRSDSDSSCVMPHAELRASESQLVMWSRDFLLLLSGSATVFRSKSQRNPRYVTIVAKLETLSSDTSANPGAG